MSPDGSNPLGPPPDAPPVAAPPLPEPQRPTGVRAVARFFVENVREYFAGDDPTAVVALVPLCFLSMGLFTRHPFRTNFIFDEQEALLANPYVRAVLDRPSKIGWLAAFQRDFWGLPPDRTIGSYRPIPNLIWRALWALGARETPFLHHWVNVLLHGLVGALITVFVMKMTRDKLMAWLAGAAFVACAVLTEAVSGVVGIADVLGALGAILALLALFLPTAWMPLGVFAATLFGLLSKESALCCVPLVPFAAFVLADTTHPAKPRRWLRTALSLLAATAAFVLYTEGRRRLFPTHLPAHLTIEANAHKPLMERMFAAVLRWFAQPMLPHDTLNNPLIGQPTSIRIAGALRVYWRGLTQVVFPWTLSGDYSAPQEPAPTRLIFPESVLGFIALVGPSLGAAWLSLRIWLSPRVAAAPHAPIDVGPYRSDTEPIPAPAERDLRPLVAIGFVWLVVSYFPVSNIPVVLPTVRAERFWYFPALGTSMLLGVLGALLLRWARARGQLRWAVAFVVAFFAFQGFAARRHANDYSDDLAFWKATRKAVPRSAKAHLNYSVMVGARGDLRGRLAANKIGLELAPQWPMASVYYGDTLCRLHRVEEAFPHYIRGFELGPNDVSLIALGLQCIWDEKAFGEDSPHRQQLEDAGLKHPGSWLQWLVRDMAANGEAHKGVDPKHRPRGYNEGPKKE